MGIREHSLPDPRDWYWLSMAQAKGTWMQEQNMAELIHPNLNCSLEEWASVRTLNREKLSLDEWTERLATILEFLLEQFKPDRFILSGELQRVLKSWVELIEEKIAVPVVISKYGDLTGAVGAAKAPFGVKVNNNMDKKGGDWGSRSPSLAFLRR